MKKIALAAAFTALSASGAIACDGDNNVMTPERQAVLAEVNALNGTPVGQYLINNGVGQFVEKSMARCGDGSVFRNGQYLGDAFLVLDEPFPEYATSDATDAETVKAIDEYATNLGHHVCNMREINATSDIEVRARSRALSFMTMKAGSEVLFEPDLKQLSSELKTLKDQDFSVCGKINQRYQTLGLK